MPTHAEKRFLRYTPEQMFDLVADVRRYPEFLPWCVGARIVSKTEKDVVADLTIGFKASFLIEILNNIPSTEVLVELSDPTRAGIIVPMENKENEDLLMLLMPMMLSDF